MSGGSGNRQAAELEEGERQQAVPALLVLVPASAPTIGAPGSRPLLLRLEFLAAGPLPRPQIGP